jgi:protein-disulfide isomerase
MPKKATETKIKVTSNTPLEVDLVTPTNKAKNPSKLLKNTFNLLMKITTTQFLVLLLIVASFLIGVLVTKVQYLEKGQAGTLAAPTQPGAGANQPTQQQGLTDGQKVNVKTGDLPVLGNNNAKVKIIEFSDFECPFCEKFYTDTYLLLKKDYIDTGKVAFYFRHFPLDFHPSAKPTAMASECANEQDQFWAFHDLIFKNQTKIAGKSGDDLNTVLNGFASELGLNASQFSSCLASEKYKQNVETDQSEGATAGVNGTPTIFINGQAIIGAQPYATFKTIIDQQLK